MTVLGRTKQRTLLGKARSTSDSLYSLGAATMSRCGTLKPRNSPMDLSFSEHDQRKTQQKQESIELKSQGSNSRKKLDGIKERLVAVKTKTRALAAKSSPPSAPSATRDDFEKQRKEMATQCGDSGTQDLSTPDFSKPRIIPNDTKDKVNDFLEDELGMLTRLRTELGEYEAISSQASRNNHILEVERSRKVSVAEQLKKMEEMSAELEKVKVALDRIAAESSDTEI